MNELRWLASHRIEEVNRLEYQWVLVFDKGARATIECMWRLIENGHIRLVNLDDEQQFGLRAPMGAEDCLREKLVGAAVVGVMLREDTLDLELSFANGNIFQIIPNSSGYEAWSISNPTHCFVAVGGGDLSVLIL